MRSPKDFVLIMGNSYLQTKSVIMQQYNVQRLIPHPQYNPTNLQNDIALIFINGFIPWKSIVRALPLARVTTDVGTPCLISGWGSTVTVRNFYFIYFFFIFLLIDNVTYR